MKKISLKNTVALLLPILGVSSALKADTLEQSLGSGASVVDRYRITCSAANDVNAAGLTIQVRNNTPSSPSLSVQAYNGSAATNSTDAASGDTVYSPASYLARGNGIYFIAVDKTNTGILNYTLSYQCITSQGVAAGTDISIGQDQ